MLDETQILDTIQQKLSKLEEGVYLVNGSPGSGKTRILIERAHYLVNSYSISPFDILIVSFSNSAVDELKKRLKEDIRVCTLHSYCNSLICKEQIIPPKVMSRSQKKYFLQKSLKQAGIDIYELSVIELMITQAKNRMKDSTGDKEVDRVWQAYEEMKAEAEVIDFDDMLLGGYNVVSSTNDYNYGWLMVDEAHDLSALQHRIIDEMHDGNLFLVASLDQSVYQWRCAIPELIEKIDSRYDSVKAYKLERNYRCKSRIVEFANPLAKYIKGQPDKEGGTVDNLGHYDDPSDEADAIVETITEGETAILYRTNWYALELEVALRQTGIGYTLLSGGSFFELPEVQDMIAYLKLSIDTTDMDAFSRVYNRPNRYLSKKWKRKFDNCDDDDVLDRLAHDFKGESYWRRAQREIHRLLTDIQEAEFPEQVLSIVRRDYDSWWVKEAMNIEEAKEVLMNIDRFQIFTARFKDIPKLLEFIENDHPEGTVTLATGHSIKGHEFRHVHVAGCTDGLIPHTKSENIDEERRLLYVMFTRAKDRLTYSSATWRQFKKPSRFLRELI